MPFSCPLTCLSPSCIHSGILMPASACVDPAWSMLGKRERGGGLGVQSFSPLPSTKFDHCRGGKEWHVLADTQFDP